MLPLLIDALASQYGIILYCEDTTKAKQALYRAGREGGITGISIRSSPFDSNHLWLVKKTPDEQ